MISIKKAVNEKSSCQLLLSFFDENKVPVTPENGLYQIDDLSSGTSILAETSFTPSGPTHILDITADQNRILDQSDIRELRIVTVTCTWNSGAKQETEEIVYPVANLKKKT